MEPRKLKKINFTGVSGTGKTTLAKWVAEEYKIPFLSGSYSDLVPATKTMPHQDMINQDAQTVFSQDMQVLNLRNKLFQSEPEYVSDRSYLDSAAYFLNKLSHRVNECDSETFMETCRALSAVQITHLIFIPFTQDYLKEWEMEDNHKRIMNRYYQWQVSEIMFSILYRLWNYHCESTLTSKGKLIEGTGYILTPHGGEYYKTKVQILYTQDLELRKQLVKSFINMDL